MVADRADAVWSAWALQQLAAEETRSGETHLHPVRLSHAPGIHLYIKDESLHPTGSLKHRLALSMFRYAICNRWIAPDTTVVESSSGSTAVSEAYFARLLGLPFVAVCPATTAREKLDLIEAYGGRCYKVDDPGTVYAQAARIAAETGGHYMDQFTYAERATDWRGGNIAQAIFSQMRDEPHPEPRWVVCGAGTGGTSATIGRHIRYSRHNTRLCVVDPEASVFHRHYADRSVTTVTGPGSRIEGIGRPRVEPSFIPDVVDRMITVRDCDGMANARHLSRVLGLACGPSTGVNLQGCLDLIDEMVEQGETGSIVTLLCDSGDRYKSTCFNEEWCRTQGLDPQAGHARLEHYLPLMSG